MTIILNLDDSALFLDYVLNARRETLERLDQRTCPAEDIPMYRNQPDRLREGWFGVGRGHGVNETGAFRFLESTEWVWRPKDLEEVTLFLHQNPRAVLQWSKVYNMVEVVQR